MRQETLIFLLSKSIECSIEAGRKILEVYGTENFELQTKDDQSPLTTADTISNLIITNALIETQIPVISEENKNESYAVRKNWDYCWIVDPLDGTKEFINRNGEFTTNIALVHKGIPILGVVYAPILNTLYYALENKGAYKVIKDFQDSMTMVNLFDLRDKIEKVEKQFATKLNVVGSRSHMSKETLDFIATLKGNYEKVNIISKGSSLKFCMVAESTADIYPRFGPTMEWDTAAGHAICRVMGNTILEATTGKPLEYNKKSLLNPNFIVKSS